MAPTARQYGPSTGERNRNRVRFRDGAMVALDRFVDTLIEAPGVVVDHRALIDQVIRNLPAGAVVVRIEANGLGVHVEYSIP